MLIVCAASVAYWYLQTNRSVDEYVTALSWNSLIAIITGGLTAFSLDPMTGLSRRRVELTAAQANAKQGTAKATPRVFGIVSAGIVYLCLTVVIEWLD